MGIIIDVNAEHPWNELALILVTELPIVTDINELHPPNAFEPILVTELGIIIDVNALHEVNAFAPILVNNGLVGSVTDDNNVHPVNA